MLIEAQEGVQGGTLAGGSPFSLRLYVCAVTLGGFRYPLLPFDPISLVLSQRNGVEPPKKSAFLPWYLHHPRERSCLSCLYSSSPDFGRGLVGVGGGCVCAVSLGGGRNLITTVTPAQSTDRAKRP